MSTSQGYTRHIQMNDDEVHNLHVWKTIVARAWIDDDFRQDLVSDPNRVLAPPIFSRIL